jgi:Family of unknown function (DUF5723)
MNLKLRILIAIIFLSNININGQQYLGVTSSNYGGTNSLYANPANIVGSRHKVFVNLAAADFYIGNNWLKWNAPYSFYKLTSGAIVPKKKEIWRSSFLTTIENNKNKNINSLIDLRGPAVLFAIDDKQALAITSRGRGGVSINNLSQKISVLIQKGSKATNLINKGDGQNLSLNMNAFTEIGFTYGRDISLNAEEAIKVAASIKRIIGITNFHFIGKNGDFDILSNVPDPDDVNYYYDNVLKINNMNSEFGHSDLVKGVEEFSFRPSYWFSKDSPGRGLGFDLGISYEFRPEIQKYIYKEKGVVKVDQTQNKYQYKFGVSLIDIGRVRFNNPAFVDNFRNSTKDKFFFEDKVDKKRAISNEKTDLKVQEIQKTLEVSGSDDINDFSANLPMTFQTYFDFKVRENVYVYGTWVQNLRAKDNLGMRMPSQISVVPRYESKWFEVACSISLLNDYQLFAYGLSARVGPLFLGSDNLQGLLNFGKPRGIDIYAGLNIPIHHKRPKSATSCAYDAQRPGLFSFLKRTKKPKKTPGDI